MGVPQKRDPDVNEEMSTISKAHGWKKGDGIDFIIDVLPGQDIYDTGSLTTSSGYIFVNNNRNGKTVRAVPRKINESEVKSIISLFKGYVNGFSVINGKVQHTDRTITGKDENNKDYSVSSPLSLIKDIVGMQSKSYSDANNQNLSSVSK